MYILYVTMVTNKPIWLVGNLVKYWFQQNPTHSPHENTCSHLLLGKPSEFFLGPCPHVPYLIHLLVQCHVALVEEVGRLAVTGLTGQTGQSAMTGVGKERRN